MLNRTKGSAHASRFQPLADHLAKQGDDEVVLDFARIEAIIGHPLSVSMQTGPELWTVPTKAAVRCWRSVGWRARLDIKGRRVVFTRDAEGAADAGR